MKKPTPKLPDLSEVDREIIQEIMLGASIRRERIAALEHLATELAIELVHCERTLARERIKPSKEWTDRLRSLFSRARQVIGFLTDFELQKIKAEERRRHREWLKGRSSKTPLGTVANYRKGKRK